MFGYNAHFRQLSFSVLDRYVRNSATMLSYPCEDVFIAYDWITAIDFFALERYFI
jgi:hypothetical protein